jgi:hypothetical protein
MCVPVPAERVEANPKGGQFGSAPRSPMTFRSMLKVTLLRSVGPAPPANSGVPWPGP